MSMARKRINFSGENSTFFMKISEFQFRNVPIIRNTFGGRGVQRFVTKPCKDIGICTVFVTKERGSENPGNRVTYSNGQFGLAASSMYLEMKL
jgi:hypothetical protein